MLGILKRFWEQLTCAHFWKYDGTKDDSESHWHWHKEKCDNCGKKREVMNDYNRDACGHCSGDN